jgi:hypothetical protein
MSTWRHLCLIACLSAASAFGADENLRYSIHWPTGLSLGEGALSVTQKGLKSSFRLDASFPGVPVIGEFSSSVNARGCTESFRKVYTFGLKKTSETITVVGGQATRTTGDGGGTSTQRVGECIRDALAYLNFLRAELNAGRRPGMQRILFGAQYELRLDYKGTQKVASGDETVETDHFQCQVKGPASETSFEVNFARDAARTPVKFVVSTTLGTFTMDLVREPQ